MDDQRDDLVAALRSIATSLKRIAPPKGWEYGYFYPKSDEDLFTQLNERAADGWELVYIAQGARVMIKRPRK